MRPGLACRRVDDSTGGSSTATLPARRSRRENSMSSINGMGAKPPSARKVSRLTKIDWSPKNSRHAG